MRKKLWQILALCLGISFLASAAVAKVWLLPDYQSRQFFSHRVNDLDSSTPSRDPVKRSSRGKLPYLWSYPRLRDW